MRELRYICPVCGDRLQEVAEHLDATDSQPEYEAQFWCTRCQEYIYEYEAERE